MTRLFKSASGKPLLVAIGAALATSCGATADTLEASPALAAPSVPGSRSASLSVNFLARCKVSRTGPDDPIVFPGQPGRSHHHTFFGNRRISAYSTYKTLSGGTTTCNRKGDTAAYWVPTLFLHDREVKPRDAVVYYTLRQHTPVRPYPAGLKMIAGDAHAIRPQSLRVTWWTCAVPDVVRASSSAPRDCGKEAILSHARLIPRSPLHARRPGASQVGIQLHVRFPDCWDGRHLDSADHKSHMAYSRGGRCARTHPVLVPSLILIVTYPISSGTDVELASGGQYSGHADFINAWKQVTLNRIVHDCRMALPRCARR
jgi:hypothetical protein